LRNCIHHKEVRLALGNFAVCRVENVLHLTGFSTLAEIREQDTDRIEIRIITNESHSIRSYYMNNKIHHDEYATKQRTIKPIFIRAIEYLGHNRFHAETAKILEEKYNEHIKIYTDGSKNYEKIGCLVITPDQKFKKHPSKQYTLPNGQVNSE
jgi:undecaprenyl pyrophosphate synthase